MVRHYQIMQMCLDNWIVGETLYCTWDKAVQLADSYTSRTGISTYVRLIIRQ